MGRRARAAVVPILAAALAASGCGEPLMVLGDAPGLMRVVLGYVGPALPGTDTAATRIRVIEPRAVAYHESTGMLYVADRGSVGQSGGLTTQLARIYEVGPTGRATQLLNAGGCSAGVCLMEPTHMALASDGALIITDAVGSRIFRYVPGGALTVVAGTGVAATAPDGAAASGSPVHQPAGVAVAPDGRIFFSEMGGRRIRVIDGAGLLGTVAGTGESGYAGDGGAATLATFTAPAGLALHDGTLYIADQGSHSVRAVSPAGLIRTIAGIPGIEGFQGDGGPATGARLSWPYGVTVGAGGRALFITDRQNYRVRVVDLDAGLIRTFAGTGSRTFNGLRLTAGETALANPTGIVASRNGLVFIVDSGTGVVWRTSTGFE